MAMSINNVAPKGQIASPLTNAAQPFKPPDKLPNDLDITKHIQDTTGVTNMHIHTIGHNNNAIEFVGSKDHMNYTQWPITPDMANIISNNNNLNKKYQPLVIPYSAACYACNENKHKSSKKILIIVLIIVVCIVIIFMIIILVNKRNTINEDKKRGYNGQNRQQRNSGNSNDKDSNSDNNI